MSSTGDSCAARSGRRITSGGETVRSVAAATELTARGGLADRVSFHVDDALALRQPDDQFELTLFHVGMNIADKHGRRARWLHRTTRIARHRTPSSRLSPHLPDGRVLTLQLTNR